MIDEKSVEWAIEFISKKSDGDLFPKILEFEVINQRKKEFAKSICSKDLDSINIGAHRRFIVPKETTAFRQATQLDPQDSIILTSVIYQYGNQIEKRRLPTSQVFSYRFSPNVNDGLYLEKDMWDKFWNKAKLKSCGKTIVYCDIADFYNQIYHHIIENQLEESGFPFKEIKWIKKLLNSTTANVSRGLPIGPHPIHLLAEMSLIPIDNSLKSKGYDFIRYVDDILFFCEDDAEANIILLDVASVLDKQHRLMLQKHKTKIYNEKDFEKLCNTMIENRPINDTEKELLGIVNKYSGGDPYMSVFFNSISAEDWNKISEDAIASIIEEYLNQNEIDFVRLRWLYRRLAQIGHPGAINVTFNNFKELTPCFANICTYLSSVQNIYSKEWKNIGTKIIDLLNTKMVLINPYYTLQLLSLFTKNEYINHFSSLSKIYSTSEAFAKREILLAAKINKTYDWLREHKEDYINMESWQKSAFIYGLSGLPRDERKFFINSQRADNVYIETLFDYVKNQ